MDWRKEISLGFGIETNCAKFDLILKMIIFLNAFASRSINEGVVGKCFMVFDASKK